MVMFKNILVPTDNSQYSKEAFQYALNLAGKYQSTIYVLHIVESKYIDQFYLFKSDTSMSATDNVEEDIIRKKTEETENFIKKSVENNKEIEIKKIIKKGKPHLEIIAAARENNIDLIIISTHGKTGLSEALMGSVAEKVIKKVPCPVLSVKPKDFIFKMP